jgi:divalent metal cation (Fe/Co/Zn/Cd) transporter
MDGQISLVQAHEICDKLENKICSAIDRCEVFVHAEPFYPKSKI